MNPPVSAPFVSARLGVRPSLRTALVWLLPICVASWQLGGCSIYRAQPLVHLNENRERLDWLPVIGGSGVFHTVKAGESPYRIAQAYGLPVDDLLGVNDVLDPRALQVGDVLFIPGAEALVDVPVPKAAPAPAPGMTEAQRLFANRAEAERNQHETAETERLLRDKVGVLDWPVDGIVTSRFGVRGARKHDGIDISAPEGTPVVAAGNGVVLYSGAEHRGYGNLIIIRHDGGLVTIYAHNRENLVKEGQKIDKGQSIARVGQTGRAEGPHLHFEVRQLDRPKNPLLFLP